MTNSIDDFKEILLREEPLSRYSWLRVGGPAELFFTPRTRDELFAVVSCCRSLQIPMQILGGGSNILVNDEGVRGAVIRLFEPLLSNVTVDGLKLTAEGGALLSHVVSEAVRAGLAGLEHLVGVPGTVGGAVVGNSGGRLGDMGQVVKSVTVLTQAGDVAERSGDELTFSYRRSNLHDLVVLSVVMELTQDDTDELTRRMRKNWIMKRSTQPLSDQSAGCIFRNPRGLSAGALIEQCGLKGVSVGKARVSDRHANFIVTEEGATSADVWALIDRIRKAVQAKFSVDLELEIRTWPTAAV